MRLAVYGGSFDPFHNGHLALARELLRLDLCDAVHLVPADRSPFKDPAATAASHRLAMTRLGAVGHAGLVVDDREIRRGGPNWTVDTLTDLRAEQPDATLLLVLGADAWAAFGVWRAAARILELAAPVVAPRDDAAIPPQLGVAPRVLDGFRMPIASTDLRRRLSRGEPVADDLPPAVLAYIRAHALYGHRGAEPCP
jgi:nicotinate-nucleotide adenylyltransferase